MKLYLTLITLSIALLININVASAQSHQDSIKKAQKILTPQEQKQRQHNFYKRSLNIDSAKAVKVADIQDTYKAGMKKVVADQSLSQEARSAKIKALMEEKNQKLRAILSPTQQEKIIPTTEREPFKGAKKD